MPEAELGMVQPQAKECWQPPEIGRGRKDSPLEPLEGTHPGDTLILGLCESFWTSGLQSCKIIDFC